MRLVKVGKEASEGLGMKVSSCITLLAPTENVFSVIRNNKLSGYTYLCSHE